MNREPEIITAEKQKIYRRSNVIYIFISLVPLTCLALLLYFYVFPVLIHEGKTLILYTSLAILTLVFTLSLLGYFFALRGIRRMDETSRAPGDAFPFFAKVYVLVSLIPLVCIALLLFIYVIPNIPHRQNAAALYAMIGVVGFTAIMSLLGFFLIKRDMVGGMENILKSRDKLDRLVKISASILEVPHSDIVFDRIVRNTQTLLNVGAVYLFVREDKKWLLRSELGPAWDQYDPESRESMENMMERSKTDRQILCFDGDFLRGQYFQEAPVPIQVLGAPILDSEEMRGFLLLVCKHSQSGGFSDTDLEIMADMAVQCGISIKNAEFHETQTNYFTHTIELLVLSLEGNLVPSDHLHNVARYAGMMARPLELEESVRRNIHFAALLHDVGMIKIPAEKQSVPEFYKTHPALGAELVSRIILWRDLAPIIRHHHENYDGSGYPDALMGPEIPLSARIIAVAESFDAITNPNSYRTVIPFDDALEDLKTHAGSRYDPKLVEIFEQHFRESESGY